ncbi:MAG: hypothetical protein R6U52_10370 [Kosmotogaceae bacterium]
MLKRIAILFIALMVMFSFSSCFLVDMLKPAELPETVEINQEDMKELEDTTNKVLKKNSNDERANIVKALIEFFQALKKLSEIELPETENDILNLSPAFSAMLKTVSNQSLDHIMDFDLENMMPGYLSKEFLTNLPEKFSVEKIDEFTVLNENDCFDVDVTALQNEIEEVVKLLESSWNRINNHLSADMDIGDIFIYPNKFDWSGNGTVNSTEEIVLLVTGEKWTPEDGWEDIEDEPFGLYSDILIPLAKEECELYPDELTIDETGGDAWLDFGFLEWIADDATGTYTVEFTDDDHIAIGAGELSLVKIIEDILQALLVPTIVWDLQPSQGSIDFFCENQDNEDFMLLLFEELDPMESGVIDSASVKGFVGNDFLTFRNSDSPSRITYVRTLLLDIPETGRLFLDELFYGVEDNRKIVNPYWINRFFDISLEDWDDAYDDMNNELDTLENELDPIVDEDVELNEEVTMHPYVLFNQPNNFSDLLAFFPTINYNTETMELISIVLPDSTFGGLFTGIPDVFPEE